LAQYCFSFLQAISTFSYKVLPPLSLGEDYSLFWPDQHTHPHDIQAKAEKALSDFQASHLSSTSASASERIEAKKGDVLVFPVIQAGQFNIREEERSLFMLFSHLATLPPSSSPLLDLTSGYFGLYKKYQDLILQSSTSCRIVAASPKVIDCLRAY
jgi:CDP-diacylglycerol--glycerol-3-phosphate 3-phosphatidyltransferase